MPPAPEYSQGRRPYLAPTRPATNAGFTLIEVLVSLSILAIALVAVVHSALSVQDAFTSTQEKERCAMLADVKLTESKLLGLDQLIQDQGTFSNFPSYSWKVQTSPTRADGLTELTVTVWPTAQDPDRHGMTVNEYVYREGQSP